MPSLAEKFAALGIQTGAQGLKPRRPPAAPNLDDLIGGHTLETPQGEIYVIEQRYPADHRVGSAALHTAAPLTHLAAWAGDPGIASLAPEEFAFLDTETTGLFGGGTYAFLVGVGRVIDGEFHLLQYFLRQPSEESAQLLALEHFLAPCKAVVTFNGKTFDLPLLAARFAFHGWHNPFKDLAHVDLLHLARRLWRDRLPNRALISLEAHILGAGRSGEDVPGWMVPSLYMDYLRDGNVEPLKHVLYHNAMDVVSMAALLTHMAEILDDPMHGRVEHGVDYIALGRLFEDLNNPEMAAQLYFTGLEHDLPRPALLDGMQRLALLFKRQGQFEQAIRVWEQAAIHHHLEAHIELAKHYEHQVRDYDTAQKWTLAALELLTGPEFSRIERAQQTPEIEKRLSRLMKKRTGKNE